MLEIIIALTPAPQLTFAGMFAPNYFGWLLLGNTIYLVSKTFRA